MMEGVDISATSDFSLPVSISDALQTCAEPIDVLPNDKLSTAVTVGLDRPRISSPSPDRPFSRSTSLQGSGAHMVWLAIVLN